MGDYTLRFGERNQSNNQYPTINIQGLGNTSTSPTKTEWTQFGIGLGANLIGCLLTGVAAKNMSGTGSSEVNKGNQTQPKAEERTPQQKIAEYQQKISDIQVQIAGCDNQLSEVGETDPKALEADKKELDAKKTELFNKETEKGKLANEILVKQETFDALTQKYTKAVGDYNLASNNLNSLQDNLTSAQNVLAKNPDDENAKQVKADSEAKIPQAKQNEANAKIAMQEAEKLKNNAEKELKELKEKQPQLYDEVATEIETYNQQKQKYEMNAASIKTNIKLKEEAANKRAELIGQKAFYEGQIKSLQVQVVKQQGDLIKQKETLGAKYTEADAKDGNWWSRTWQKTKGIFNKQERLEYQQMKEAHEAKDAAVDAMKALGGSKSDLKAMQNDSVTVSVEKFFNGKQKIDGIEDDIADAIRTGGTAAAENVYNQELENLATEKAEAFISKQVKNKTYDSKSQTKAIYNDDKYKKQIIEMYESNLEITDEQIKAKLNLS